VRNDPLGELLSWACSARYEDLPATVVSASKTQVFNTVAAMLAGSTAPGAPQAVAQLREWGGAPQSTVVAHGLKAPAPLAAFANGVMAHAMDFDDTQVGTGFHGNVTIVPALLAVAETRPEASGRDFVLAHAVGLEIACRMTLAATRRAAHPWLTTTLFGVFGAAISAGRLLALDLPTLRQAVGIVYSSAGGNRQGLLDGTLIQRVQPGLCAQAAVTATGLARHGITGAQDVFEGRYGLYPSYYGSDYQPMALLEGLGGEFRLLDIALKAYPCCSYSQEPVDATLELQRMHGFAGDDVADVMAYVVSAHAAGLVDRPYAPRSCAQVDAQFSLQFVIAAALRRGALGIADFQERTLADPAVLALSGRVRVGVDPEREGVVEIRLKDGRQLSHRVPRARGHPANPLDLPALRSKLRECALQAAVARSEEQIAALERDVMGLEQVRSAATLAALLA